MFVWPVALEQTKNAKSLCSSSSMIGIDLKKKACSSSIMIVSIHCSIPFPVHPLWCVLVLLLCHSDYSRYLMFAFLSSTVVPSLGNVCGSGSTLRHAFGTWRHNTMPAHAGVIRVGHAGTF